MSTAKVAGRGGVLTTIAPHRTGHQWMKDGTLLRVDCERGIGWVAAHYDLNLQSFSRPGVPMRKYTAQWRDGQQARYTPSDDTHWNLCGSKIKGELNVEFQSAGRHGPSIVMSFMRQYHRAEIITSEEAIERFRSGTALRTQAPRGEPAQPSYSEWQRKAS